MHLPPRLLATLPLAAALCLGAPTSSRASLLPATPVGSAPEQSAAVEHTVDVDVIDVGSDKITTTTRFAVATAEGKTGVVKTVVAPFSYDVTVHCDAAQGARVPVALSFSRRDSRPGSPGDINTTITIVAAVSQRVSVGKVVRPDGGSTEIAVRVH